MDYRRLQGGVHTPTDIKGTAVERFSCFRFPGIIISEDLSWSHQAARQRLFFLWWLRRFSLVSRIDSHQIILVYY